jgi:hypothetical protein
MPLLIWFVGTIIFGFLGLIFIDPAWLSFTLAGVCWALLMLGADGFDVYDL